MALRIEVTGHELAPSDRIRLSKALRQTVVGLFPGTKTEVVVKFRAEAQIIPLRAMIRQRAHEALAAKHKATLHTSLHVLGLRQSIVTRLADDGITTVGGLVRRTEIQLLKIPGIGRRQLEEIIRVLAAHGRKLAE